ncbi:AAA family ATPase [Herbiconiux moechotypicola]|uniref:LuxR family transcriptional regulator n=1 Tax=Herbiconiux moechotypicola TaxID=637393 RepID=A0ABN3DEH7_9MICO|nr:AAA family ATPase [Herbiconiux moechotypicola]MCS5729307.1 AAA family ATPase [Herbiconiux moechotypicola]
MTTLVGRDHELAVLRDAVVQSQHGHGRSVLVEGDAGIGKSALLDTVAAEAAAAGFTTLTCRGTRAGTESGFAGLHQLLHPVIDRVAALPSRQRRTLEVAFGIVEGSASDGLVLSIATLGVVEELVTTGPVLLLVEDLHWIDRSSAEVIAFLASRLATTRVLLLASTRSEARYQDWSGAFSEVVAPAPLSDESAERLLETVGPHVPPPLRRRILAASSGNPLALTEFAAEAVASTPREPAPGRLTLPRRLEQAFLAETATLPERTRSALLVAAAGEDSSFEEIVSAAGALGLTALDFVPAERSRVLTVREGSFAFRHPLISSALYDTADSQSRAVVHRALAASSADTGRSVRHQAAAAFGVDEEVAGRLEEVAATAARQGARAEATESWRRAAALSPDIADRGRRLAEAAESARQAGDIALAIDLVQEARAAANDVDTLRRVTTTEWILSQTTAYAGRTVRELVGVAEQLDDPAARIEMLVFAAVRTFILQEPADVAAEVAAALEATGADDSDVFYRIGRSLVDPRSRLPIEAMLPSFRRQLSPSDSMLLNCLAFSAESSADLDGAVLVWNTAQAAFHDEGRSSDESTALCGRGGLRITAGAISAGLADAEQALMLSLDLDLAVVGAMAAAEVARARARRGDRVEAEAALATSVRLGGAQPFARVAAVQSWAAGLLALGENRYAEAVQSLLQTSVNESVELWAGLDLAEAAARLGTPEVIAPWLARAEIAARRTESAHLWMLVAAAKAVTTEGDDARPLFEEALDWGGRCEASTDVARIRLLYGEWLRRSRHIVEARTHLRAALAGFRAESLYALAERAAGELRAAGEGEARDAVSRGSDLATRLTAQELLVVRLAAQGLTNKEIADQVYLSHRTVGAHLHRAFAKLGVTRRGQLGALIDD